MSDEQAAPRDEDELSPGAMLARARAERGLAISEVAERLKYGARQIEALEADDYSRLPGTTFVRGMIRGYAKLVAMDPAPVLKALERRNIPAVATVDLRTSRIPFPDGHRHATRMYLVFSVIALLAIAAVLYEWHFAEAPPAPVAARIAPTVPPAAPEPVVAAPAETGSLAPSGTADAGTAPGRRATGMGSGPGKSGRIGFIFEKESWVEIKDREGKTLLSQLNSAGTQKMVEGAPPFSVIIGNATNVRVTYNDEPVDLRPYVKVEVARLKLE